MQSIDRNIEKIYIVASDSVLRTNLSFFFGTRGFTVHVCSKADEFTAGLDYLAPGCVLLETCADEPARFDLVTALANHRVRLPIVIMTASGDVAMAVAAMKAGAVDFITMPVENQTLLESVVHALNNLDTLVRDHDRRTSASERLATLTARETDVLRGLTVGRSNKLLAFDFGISIRTVEMHRSSMMDRLGVRTLAEALYRAFDAAAGANTMMTRRAA